MGAKGTSVNITDMSAAYVTLKGLVDKIGGLVTEINTHKKGVIDEINSGSIDDKSAAELEEILAELTSIADSISRMLEEIQKKLDAGLRTCQEIERIAKAQAGTARENVSSTGKKFKR